MKRNFLTLLLTFLAGAGFAQAAGFNVFGTLTNPYSEPYQLLTLDTLSKASTLRDINAKYRPDWVASYISVEIATTCAGSVRKAVSKDDVLTGEQLELLKTATPGCKIDVEVDYIPANNLTYNPPRTLGFSLRPAPIFEAKFPGGAPQLRRYLRENILDEISTANAGSVKLAKVRFTVTESGQVTDVRVFESSGEETVDNLILEAICNMPAWQPAKNAKGGEIPQEFEFSMGTDLLRCDYQY